MGKRKGFEKVSVIIPTMKGREGMLEKLLSTLPERCEKIVVDDEDLLLAAKRNKGAKKAKRKYLLFIDDDNYLDNFAVECMVRGILDKPGIVGMVACYDDDKGRVADGGSLRSYSTGFTKGLHTNRQRVDLPRENYEVDEVANSFMIRRAHFRALGGFDEEAFPIDLDEADLCKRAKDAELNISMCPWAFCFHKSQTYSYIPDFRRPMNAYYMGRNRVLYQKKHLNKLDYFRYLVLFMPMFVVFYCLSLTYRRKPQMIKHFMKGVFDGVRGRRENRY